MPPSRRTDRRRSVPRRRVRLLSIVLALVVGGTVGVSRLAREVARDHPTDLHYVVAVTDPAAGVLEITLEIPAPQTSLHLGFSRNSLSPTAPASKFRVRSIEATGGARAIDRSDGDWSASTGGEPTTVRYEVHLNGTHSSNVFAEEGLSAIDPEGARLLGSDVFLFPVDQEIGAITVDYRLPDGWALHHPFATDTFAAALPNLRALYSSVVGIGHFRHAVRDVRGVEIRIVLRGEFAFGDDDLIGVVERIVAHQLDFFGDSPYDHYLFVVDAHPHHDDPQLLHYFGLHFDASMLVLLDPRTDRSRLHGEPASLFAHEFFHNWLGEHVQQKGYAMNWFVEGITTLYAYRTRLATGMLDRGRYAEEISSRHREQWAGESLRGNLSLAEAGEIVLQDPAITRMTYTGGLLVGIALDDAIVRETQGDASLDDVLRGMAERARIEPAYRLTRATLEAELARVSGRDFGPWLERYVYGVEDLPLPTFVTGR